MKRPLITLANVSARRGDRVVFRNTNWSLRAGEYWAVVGATGSGKSTLAEILTSALPIVRGEILYHFLKDPEGVPSPHEVIHVALEDQQAMMSEAASYYQARWNSADEELAKTVDEYLSAQSIYAVSPFQVTGDEDIPKAFQRNRAAAIRRLGIQSLLSRRLADLSNGESRKVLLARALAQRPAVLILDDPFAGLDMASRERLSETVRDGVAQGLAVILISSHSDELPPGVTHVAEVARHRLVWTGRRGDRKKARVGPRAAKVPPSLFRTTSGRSIPEVLVQMRKVTVRYGRAVVLRGIDWTIRKGERWALLGPNGSGKTTLIGLIMGDHPQGYANDLTLFGRRRDAGLSIWDIKERIGWISPEIQMHFPGHLTGFEAVCSGYFNSMGLYQRCTAAQRQQARRLMRNLDLRRFAEAPLQDLSPGEQRLLLLARALVKNPWLLILDEPCQALDDEQSRHIISVVDQWARASAGALIYVTHRREELPDSINRTLIL